MKMPPIRTRKTRTAISRVLFLEKGIDITAKQAVVGELRPGLLPELVGDDEGWSQGEQGLLPAVDIALHVGQHGWVVGQRPPLPLLLGCEHGGHGFPYLAARAQIGRASCRERVEISVVAGS